MKNKGFTLIELLVVIIILGILSVAAAPKFLNLQRDAKIAALDGFVGAFNAANEIVMGKAAIAGVEHAYDKTEVPGTGIFIEQGYINLAPSNIKKAMDTDGYTVFYPPDTGYSGSVFVYLGEEVPLRSLRTKLCFLLFDRDITNGATVGQAGQKYGELKVNRFYDGC